MSKVGDDCPEIHHGGETCSHNTARPSRGVPRILDHDRGGEPECAVDIAVPRAPQLRLRTSALLPVGVEGRLLTARRDLGMLLSDLAVPFTYGYNERVKTLERYLYKDTRKVLLWAECLPYVRFVLLKRFLLKL